MTVTIDPKILAAFEAADLKPGGHGSSFNGEACAMEWVSLLADEGFTDAPECASPVLRRYVINLNDRWDTAKRQELKPYLIRMIGTGSDGKDKARIRIARTYVAEKLLPEWLRLAGMDDQIALLNAAAETGDWSQLRKACWAVGDAAYAKRRAVVEEAVRAELAKREKPDAAAAAVAAADAAAVAAAAAVADAVADADAVAVAAAVAVADAVAAAVADAVADAVAVAAAAAAAVADADAVAAADAVAVAAAAAVVPKYGERWNQIWRAAYDAARPIYEARFSSPDSPIKQLADKQAPAALDLLDLLIEADESAVSA